MRRPDAFTFESYKLDRVAGTIALAYSFSGGTTFTESITLPGPVPDTIPEAEVDAALFALHLIGGISYFKAYCPPRLIIKSGQLNATQAAFWQTVYEKGLGEFSFHNQLDLRGKIAFPVTDGLRSLQLEPRSQGVPRRVISLFGGGKDSMATAQILEAARIDYSFMRLGAHPIIDNLFNKLDRPHLEVARRLDPKLIELNAAGALNGHVPITCFIATLNVVLALLYGFDAVVISSERSASNGNVEYLGEEINHQWSKSLEFEDLFRDYLRDHVTHRVDYINLLGSLSELRIAQIVTARPEYLHDITSCNVNWKWITKDRLNNASEGLWCGHCPKCTFTFALFAAWLPLQQVIEIFGANLFDLPEDEALYRELFGLEGFKPFECVGTPEEMVAALTLAEDIQPLSDTIVGRLFAAEVLKNYSNPSIVVSQALANGPELAHQPVYVSDWLTLGGITHADPSA